MFHLISGNLGYQVEHHLYPDMPSTRYAEIAPKVREICRALRAALQHRAVLQAVVHGAAHDRAAGVPRRQAAAEARALPRRAEPSAIKNENERSGFSREGYVPRWQREAEAAASNGGSASNGSSSG